MLPDDAALLTIDNGAGAVLAADLLRELDCQLFVLPPGAAILEKACSRSSSAYRGGVPDFLSTFLGSFLDRGVSGRRPCCDK